MFIFRFVFGLIFWGLRSLSMLALAIFALTMIEQSMTTIEQDYSIAFRYNKSPKSVAEKPLHVQVAEAGNDLSIIAKYGLSYVVSEMPSAIDSVMSSIEMYTHKSQLNSKAQQELYANCYLCNAFSILNETKDYEASKRHKNTQTS